MTSAPFEYRPELLHKSYDPKSYLRSRRVAAVERLLRFLYRRLAPDYRLVHRFRMWQITDLNQVMSDIYMQQKWKNDRLERGFLVLLSYSVRKGLKAALNKWRLVAASRRRLKITEEKLRAAVKIANIEVGASMTLWARRTFPIPEALGRSMRIHVLSLALATWKGASIGALLYSSRRGQGCVSLCRCLYLRAKLVLRFALQQIAIHRGWTLGLQCVSPALQRLRAKRLMEGWSGLQRKPGSAYGAVAAGTALLHNCLRSSKRRPLQLAMQQLRRWSQPLKSVRQVRRMVLDIRSNHCALLQKSVTAWRRGPPPAVLAFPVDMEIIRNQISVAAMLEQHTIARRQETLETIKRIKTVKALEAFKKRLRHIVRTWAKRGQGSKKDEDVLFEYVRFLEEQNGIEPSRLPSHIR